MAELVPAAVTLRRQINARFKLRDKASDGWIGDSAHQARGSLSQHNPDKNGWVHALDIDEDFGAPGTARKFADELIAYAASGKPGSERILYVVYEDRIASGTYRKTWWKWRGSGFGHTKHIHISFTAAAEKDGRPFPLKVLQQH